MRVPVIPLLSTLILSACLLSPLPARACASFDFAAELAAVDRALAKARLSADEASRVKELREQALQEDREARRLNRVADNYRAVRDAMTRRDVKMFDALRALGLTPIIMSHVSSKHGPDGRAMRSAANPLPSCG